jgi:hypothetical protein
MGKASVRRDWASSSKRLDRGTFAWPAADADIVRVEYRAERLARLLNGFDAEQLQDCRHGVGGDGYGGNAAAADKVSSDIGGGEREADDANLDPEGRVRLRSQGSHRQQRGRASHPSRRHRPQELAVRWQHARRARHRDDLHLHRVLQAG